MFVVNVGGLALVAEAALDGLQHAHRFGSDLGPDAVAGEGGDAEAHG
jgi:hypothetical protein